MDEGRKLRETIGSAQWPCQRLRVAYGLMVFFVFEMWVGQKLPELMAFLMLGVAVACLASAAVAIQKWRLQAQVALIKDAVRSSRRR